MMASARSWLPVLVALAGCGPRAPDPPADAVATGAAQTLADSLVLTAPGGVEVWFTASRPAVDSAGTRCVERTMQIRRGGSRINIPLLYTGAPPSLVNDSTIEARIWLHCHPGNLYRVSLRTGLPERVR